MKINKKILIIEFLFFLVNFFYFIFSAYSIKSLKIYNLSTKTGKVIATTYIPSIILLIVLGCILAFSVVKYKKSKDITTEKQKIKLFKSKKNNSDNNEIEDENRKIDSIINENISNIEKNSVNENDEDDETIAEVKKYICKNCNAELNANTKFCTKCGAKQFDCEEE